MQEHYWDNVDFADTTWIVRADTVEMQRAMAAYVQQFVPPADNALIAKLIARASATKPMLEYFAFLTETVLHDASSPLLNEELYLPVLEALVASPHLDEWEKVAPEHALKIALKNRVGHVAEDFTYTMANGKTGTMHALKADYVLIYINNPGCPMCRKITEGLIASPVVTEGIAQNRIKILAIYPDEDLAEWRKHTGDFPATWINGYDAGTRINVEGLYDLRAIPSIYIVDADKRVLARDVYDVRLVEAILQSAS